MKKLMLILASACVLAVAPACHMNKKKEHAKKTMAKKKHHAKKTVRTVKKKDMAPKAQ